MDAGGRTTQESKPRDAILTTKMSGTFLNAHSAAQKVEGRKPGIFKGLRGAFCNSGHPCPPLGPAELFKIDPVNFVVTFFSRKRKPGRVKP
jgi:hypothetical protein